jgi:hypothetical protein
VTRAQAILRDIADDPEAKPREREEARAALTLFSYLGLRDERALVLFLLQQSVALQQRIDQLEGKRGG